MPAVAPARRFTHYLLAARAAVRSNRADSPVICPSPMRKRWSTALCVFLGICAAISEPASAQPPVRVDTVNALQPAVCQCNDDRGSPVHRVSLVQLIANYDGCRVSVAGYLRLEFEGNAIYLARDDERHLVTANGLWVEFAPGVLTQAQQYNDQFVTLVGRFNAAHRGHRGLWSGAITDITRVSISPPVVPAGELVAVS